MKKSLKKFQHLSTLDYAPGFHHFGNFPQQEYPLVKGWRIFDNETNNYIVLGGNILYATKQGASQSLTQSLKIAKKDYNDGSKLRLFAEKLNDVSRVIDPDRYEVRQVLLRLKETEDF